MIDFDPFGNRTPADDRPTRFEKPSPGGRVRGDVWQGAPSPADTRLQQLPSREGVNELESAAAPLLGMLTRINNSAAHPDPTGLRQQLSMKVKEFERTVMGRGVTPETARAASYVLRSALDEAVLGTAWGSKSDWRGKGLGDALGGERFFSGIETLLKDPSRNLALLELMYLCLALGFEGKYRSVSGGRVTLQAIQDKLFSTIRTFRGEYERQLAPASEPIHGLRERGHEPIPLWAAVGLGVALLVAAFWALSYRLDQMSDPPFRELNLIGKDLPMPGAMTPDREYVEQPQDLEPSPTERFLKPEVEEGLVEVLRQGSFVNVRVKAANLFASGSAELQPSVLPTLERIAQALDKIEEPVQIVGHTDNDPIFSPRFRSNQRLSQARAEAVLQRLAASGVDKLRLSAKGVGDTAPIANNDTPENKAKNRRVELVVRLASSL